MEFSAYRKFLNHPSAPREASSIITPEEQNSDYESGHTLINNELWHLRTARITPTKPGAFVAFWFRNDEGETQPFEDKTLGAGLKVFVQDASRFGVFHFTREHLKALGITHSESGAGKRGFRVYPGWVSAPNAQAIRTQRAQASAFIDLSGE